MILQPTYGIDYRSVTEIKEALLQNQEFLARN